MAASLRHTINVPPAGTPLVAEGVVINGGPRIRLTRNGYLVGEWASLAALVADGVDLASVTLKETR